MIKEPIFLIGPGYRTDFAINRARLGHDIVVLMKESIRGAVEAAEIDPTDIDHIAVGNFAGELYAKQGHLGALALEAYEDFKRNPNMQAARYEAACASGSVAMVAGIEAIIAGRSRVTLVEGVELMKTFATDEAGDFLGTAAWYELEALYPDGKPIKAPFPQLFGELGNEYVRRFSHKISEAAYQEMLSEIAYQAQVAARRNPKAQARDWYSSPEHARTAHDTYNPVFAANRLKITDSSLITDGAAAAILANEEYAREYAARHGKSLDDIPQIFGYALRTAPIRLEDKFKLQSETGHVIPQMKSAFDAALKMAEMTIDDIHTAEIHDCFSSSAYAIIDHAGLTPPGEAFRVIENGDVFMGGKLPINTGGGLEGDGHPVGASGVRKVIQGLSQVLNVAEEMQVEGARRFLAQSTGGSGTTTVVLVGGLPK